MKEILDLKLSPSLRIERIKQQGLIKQQVFRKSYQRYVWQTLTVRMGILSGLFLTASYILTQKLNYSNNHFMDFFRTFIDIKYLNQGKTENFLEDYNKDIINHNLQQNKKGREGIYTWH